MFPSTPKNGCHYCDDDGYDSRKIKLSENKITKKKTKQKIIIEKNYIT